MTAQMHEQLILDGRRCTMTAFPELPADNPRVIERPEEEIKAQAGMSQLSGIFHSTACWRRYVGTWEIKAGKLYLTGLKGRYKLLGEGPLFADWASTMLVVPQGRMVKYVHMDFDSKYEREIWITITNGVETKREELGPRLLAEIDRLIAEAGAPPAPRRVCAKLHVVSGPGVGDVLSVFVGVNTIGVSAESDIRLQLPPPSPGEDDEGMAGVAYDLDQELFMLWPVPGGPLLRVNGEVLLTPALAPVYVKEDDEILIGEIGVRMERSV